VSDWKEVLAPTPQCIDVARFGDPGTTGSQPVESDSDDGLRARLSSAERAHLDACARCQAELALFREIDRQETSPEEQREVEWIVSELRQRNNVVAFPTNRWRALYAVAAALVMVIGIGWWMQLREPSIDASIDDPGIYRSARLDLIAPIGDLAQGPNELRWAAVPDASRYRVQILEVDATPVWSTDTTDTRVALPPEVIAQFAPGKSLLWEVRAFRGKEMLATSETQRVRVSVQPRTDR
jgi:hypothetical protein